MQQVWSTAEIRLPVKADPDPPDLAKMVVY